VAKYLKWDVLMLTYEELKDGEHDFNVWAFWQGIAQFYFRDYMMRCQPIITPGRAKSAYFMLSALPLKGKGWMDAVHIKNHGGTPTFSEADWAAAKREMTDYMIGQRDSQPAGFRYGIINAGCHSRFYELGPADSELRDFVGSGTVTYDVTRPLELLEDEDSIQAILDDIIKLMPKNR
jgi:hypothetical protein